MLGETVHGLTDDGWRHRTFDPHDARAIRQRDPVAAHADCRQADGAIMADGVHGLIQCDDLVIGSNLSPSGGTGAVIARLGSGYRSTRARPWRFTG